MSSSSRSIRAMGSCAAMSSSYAHARRARRPAAGPSSTATSSLQLREPVGDTGDAVAERRVEHERFGVGVVEQVPQLVVEVAVVDVDRDAAHLERAELRLEVLVAVVEVQPDLAVGSESGRDERRRHAGGAVVVLAPAPASCRRGRSPARQAIASAIDSQTVAKCISIGGHDRAVVAGEIDLVAAVGRAARRLGHSGRRSSAGAPEPPWGFEPAEFRVDRGVRSKRRRPPSSGTCLPPGGSVLDVGSGGGRGSLVLAPPAGLIRAVDESQAMLDLLVEAARAERRRGRHPPRSVAGHGGPVPVRTSSSATTSFTTCRTSCRSWWRSRVTRCWRWWSSSRIVPPDDRLERRLAPLLGSRAPPGPSAGRLHRHRPATRLVARDVAAPAVAGRPPLPRPRARACAPPVGGCACRSSARTR